MVSAVEHGKTWWYKLAERFFPARCREVPEAQNPERLVMRQFALVGRHVYLQQFCGDEDARFLHSHQWRWTIAIGLWGKYIEHRLAGPARLRRAPYFYVMDASVVHHVQHVAPGHTSIFIGIGRDDSLKKYYGATVTLPSGSEAAPRTLAKPALDEDGGPAHIQKVVRSI